MSEKDPKDTEATEPVEPAAADEPEPAAAAAGAEATSEDKPKAKPKRAPRKKAEPKAEASEKPKAEVDEHEPAAAAQAAEATSPDEPADDDAAAAEPAAEAKPKRARSPRRKKAEETAAEEPAAAPKPEPKRKPLVPSNGRPVVVRAQARYVRSSARKARLVCDEIRGKSIQDARAILATTPRAVARDWSKLLESAIANAENNHELVGDDLRVYSVHADEGPTLKRFRPRAMGRATKIRKRTSHLTILLSPKE